MKYILSAPLSAYHKLSSAFIFMCTVCVSDALVSLMGLANPEGWPFPGLAWLTGSRGLTHCVLSSALAAYCGL